MIGYYPDDFFSDHADFCTIMQSSRSGDRSFSKKSLYLIIKVYFILFFLLAPAETPSKPSIFNTTVDCSKPDVRDALINWRVNF